MLANILVQAPKQARRYCVLGRRRSWAAGACHYRHCVAPTLRIPCFIILVQRACRSLGLLSPDGIALAWTGATFVSMAPSHHRSRPQIVRAPDFRDSIDGVTWEALVEANWAFFNASPQSTSPDCGPCAFTLAKTR